MADEAPLLDIENAARRIAELALERKALNCVALDLRGRSSYADFLIICSGTSDRHVQAVAEFVADSMKKDHEQRPLGVEGLREGQWCLVDFGSVVLHVFHQFTRELYHLEQLWEEAPRLPLAISEERQRA